MWKMPFQVSRAINCRRKWYWFLQKLYLSNLLNETYLTPDDSCNLIPEWSVVSKALWCSFTWMMKGIFLTAICWWISGPLQIKSSKESRACFHWWSAADTPDTLEHIPGLRSKAKGAKSLKRTTRSCSLHLNKSAEKIPRIQELRGCRYHSPAPANTPARAAQLGAEVYSKPPPLPPAHFYPQVPRGKAGAAEKFAFQFSPLCTAPWRLVSWLWSWSCLSCFRGHSLLLSKAFTQFVLLKEANLFFYLKFTRNN